MAKLPDHCSGKLSQLPNALTLATDERCSNGDEVAGALPGSKGYDNMAAAAQTRMRVCRRRFGVDVAVFIRT